jgi:hypothetical protein
MQKSILAPDQIPRERWSVGDQSSTSYNYTNAINHTGIYEANGLNQDVGSWGTTVDRLVGHEPLA